MLAAVQESAEEALDGGVAKDAIKGNSCASRDAKREEPATCTTDLQLQTRTLG